MDLRPLVPFTGLLFRAVLGGRASRSDFLSVLTAFRWVIELPEQLGHSVGNRFVYDLAKVCL